MRIPLAGSLVTRNNNATSFSTKDQLFKNCYAEVVTNPVTGQRTIYLNKRPGFKTGSAVAANYFAVGAPCWWTGFSTGPKAVFPFKNSSTKDLRVYDSAGNIIGDTLSPASGGYFSYVTETLISGVSNLTWVVQNGSGLWKAYFLAEGAGAWTEIVSVNYPVNQTPALATAGEMVHMDGYAFIMDSRGNVWNSDLNSLANWSATSFINASSMPDGGVGLARSKTAIVAFGRASIEFFRNAGNPSGSPLSRMPEASQKIGVFAGVTSGFFSLRSVMTAGDAIFFLGIDQESGGVGVYTIKGFTVGKISNPSIDRLLNSAIAGSVGVDTYFVGTFVAHGMAHVMLNFVSISRFFCYCIDTQFWWEISSVIGVPGSCVAGGGQSYFGANQGGAGISTFGGSSPVYQDAGSAYSASVRTSLIDNGNNKRKFWKSATLIGDRQTVSGTTEILWSDDDCTTTLTQQNSYFNLPGDSGDYASTPDSAALDITGDIGIIAYAVGDDWTPAAQQAIFSKWDGAAQAYIFSTFTGGLLRLNISSTGANSLAVNSSVATGFTDATGHWLRVTRAATSGAVNFYTSDDAPSTAPASIAWTQLGTTQTLSAGVSMASTTAAGIVGGTNAGLLLNFAGKIYSAYVYDGIGGSLVSSFRIADASPRLTTFASGLTGETWTINGNASVICNYGVDMSTPYTKMTRLGSSRRRAFEITDSVNRPWRVEALELEYEEGR